ncbi:ARMADILLO-TYPE FOLD PROTEIN-RELATED [Salix koriyanagi]|uniref:ARMADILLO-TYPE FOLD PROTEIN-RELATED n=1 Tax=Salix koriyanagi TaxID=2511006 RepID=A0A9Q0WQ66_9ROSI|nr:ARMADILLO-TYPE FOLD PROTEIN-RELATED [Salix koriyanagi]
MEKCKQLLQLQLYTLHKRDKRVGNPCRQSFTADEVSLLQESSLSCISKDKSCTAEGGSNPEKRDSGAGNSVSPTSPAVPAPEKKLTLFALRLAIFEKAATCLGTLGFIWATVVLLGGFAITLDTTDFWFITIILLIEGTRIYSRSHELEWQHQATWSITDAGINSFRALKSSTHFIVESAKALFRPITRVRKQSMHARELRKNPDEPISGSRGVQRKLTQALLFLMERAYWQWKAGYCKLLEEVSRECDLGLSGMVSIRRFFYDAYSRCLEGSIFDGLKMNMVTFAMDLLASNSPDEQLIGATILRQFVMNPQFSDDTLQNIGTNISVIDRLVEVLNWKDPQEEDIRRSAAEILSKLAGKKQNSLRVAGIPGSLESISSLLQTSRSYSTTADEIGEKTVICDHAHYGFWTFNHLGLVILKKLARDHDNRGKIGNTRGLLPKIIDFTHVEERLLRDENVTPSQILTVKRSLQLVKILASTTGATGTNLRREISEIVFTISNIRDILRHGEKHPNLQKLGIEILTSLALEEDATERIGGTGWSS